MFCCFLSPCDITQQSERKEKNSVLLKNVEMSQNEERLKQQLRNESHEITEMNETIQNLTDQRNELESRVNNCHQQIEGIDELKNEISEKNKVKSFWKVQRIVHISIV